MAKQGTRTAPRRRAPAPSTPGRSSAKGPAKKATATATSIVASGGATAEPATTDTERVGIESAGNGWRPATFDSRDLRLSNATIGAARQILPPSALLPNPYPVVNQGDVPCCVSTTVASCMEAIDAQHGDSVRLSPLFNYFVARPNPAALPDLELRDGLLAAVHTGICAWALHEVPFTAAGARLRPSAAALRDAERQRIAGPPAPLRPPRFHSVSNDPKEWRGALAMGMPLAIGFWMTPAYRALTAANPVHGAATGRSDKGHAVSVLGYDDQRRVFIVKDSRGAEFGAQGLWFLPYGLLADGVVHEAWAVEKLNYE